MYKFILQGKLHWAPASAYLSQGLVAKMKWVKMCKALGFIYIKTNPIATTKTILIPEWPHQLPSCVTLGQLPNILMFHVSQP